MLRRCRPRTLFECTGSAAAALRRAGCGSHESAGRDGGSGCGQGGRGSSLSSLGVLERVFVLGAYGGLPDATTTLFQWLDFSQACGPLGVDASFSDTESRRVGPS